MGRSPRLHHHLFYRIPFHASSRSYIHTDAACWFKYCQLSFSLKEYNSSFKKTRIGSRFLHRVNMQSVEWSISNSWGLSALWRQFQDGSDSRYCLHELALGGDVISSQAKTSSRQCHYSCRGNNIIFCISSGGERGNTPNVPPLPPEIGKNCYRKTMLFPKAPFWATKFPILTKISIFYWILIKNFQNFLGIFPQFVFFVQTR